MQVHFPFSSAVFLQRFLVGSNHCLKNPEFGKQLFQHTKVHFLFHQRHNAIIFLAPGKQELTVLQIFLSFACESSLAGQGGHNGFIGSDLSIYSGKFGGNFCTAFRITCYGYRLRGRIGDAGHKTTHRRLRGNSGNDIISS